MRIVIDLQGAQASNCLRGIGRYSLSLAQAIARNKRKHEVIIALSGLFPNTIKPLRAAFEGLLAPENIRVWYAPGPASEDATENTWRRQVAERIRESFLTSLQPDIIYVSSLFEGLIDDALTSIDVLPQTVPTFVTLYDLIPLIYPDPYLLNPTVKAWYEKKINYLRNAEGYLAISASSMQDGIAHLNIQPEKIVNISSAIDTDFFHPILVNNVEAQQIKERYKLIHSFIMYTGGIDHRKNIEGLIRAYAKLDINLRSKHQLAIICSCTDEEKKRLLSLAVKHDLANDEVIFTGFIPDADLRSLYNLCALFVFPSWYEGFGLPVLEAMSCGAPVIGANTSSLPEIIGSKDALFNPFDDRSIAGKMTQVLTDTNFRSSLVQHSLKQAQKFSWDKSAITAIKTFEECYSRRKKADASVSPLSSRPRLAYISPLPPEHTGIADYSAELLPELTAYYEIDVVVAPDKISDPWINNNCTIRNVEWFDQNAHTYDRILYHFGNSTFHQHMFGLLEKHPGIVVLHDFFLSGIIAHTELHHIVHYNWTKALYISHGYFAVKKRFASHNIADIIYEYPSNLNVLKNALGVIVHSSYSKSLANQWYGKTWSTDWKEIPLLRAPPKKINSIFPRSLLKLHKDAFIVCSFGLINQSKQNHRLLDAWFQSKLYLNPKCYLIFVGENDSGEYGEQLERSIRKNNSKNKRVQITGWASPAQFRQYLAAADIAVQLRTLSRGETSGAVLDCMNYGLATIVNANGSIAELPSNTVWMLPDNFTDQELITALETLWENKKIRQSISDQAQSFIKIAHSPNICAKQYNLSIEELYGDPLNIINNRENLLQSIANLEKTATENKQWPALAQCIAQNLPDKQPRQQLLVDVSEISKSDAGSGIQRVVRALLLEWLITPPANFRVEPIYLSKIGDAWGYRYARKYTLKLLNCPLEALSDEVIEIQPHDILVAPDLSFKVIEAEKEGVYNRFQELDIQIYFILYDLLLINMPEMFPPEGKLLLENWLKAVCSIANKIICISQSVQQDLKSWLLTQPSLKFPSNQIDYFQLGSDLMNAQFSQNLVCNADVTLNALKNKINFLMVGTIEPRKGHAQVLAGFETLWKSKVEVNLIIVGKQGWMVEHLTEKIQQHPKLQKHLFWLNGISDEYLERIYAISTCLIATSQGEGFGLPLIEAAHHKLPIIARDIPIFREVASEHAYYFQGLLPENLANAIRKWLLLYKKREHPTSENMHYLSWKESAHQLLKLILN
jgi:glycosyltransferase involved in cell wall biosynthesis